MNNHRFSKLENINRGKAYEDRVCLVCKNVPNEYQSYCKPCWKEVKEYLLNWSVQDHIMAIDSTTIKDLEGKTFTVKCTDKGFCMDLIDEAGAIYRISPDSTPDLHLNVSIVRSEA